MALIRTNGGTSLKLSSVTGVFGHDGYSSGNTFTAEIGKYYAVIGGGGWTSSLDSITEILTSATGATIVSQGHADTGSVGTGVRQYCSIIKADATSVTLASANPGGGDLNYYVFEIA